MTDTTSDRLPRSVPVFSAALALAAVACVVAGSGTTSAFAPYWALTYVPLVVLAEYLVIRIRFTSRRDINALNLVEAVLTPLILVFSTPVVVAVVAGSQILAAAVRRNDVVRGSFNTAQWALAAGAGSLIFSALADGHRFDLHNGLSLLVAAAVVGAVNQTCFAVVVGLAHRRPLLRMPADLGSTAWQGWLLGFAANVTFGMLFASAVGAGPATAFFFFVPLLALHVAYREHATMAAGRSRLERVHEAARALAAPVDPARALPHFLAEVARCYRSEAVDLVLMEGTAMDLHRYRGTVADPVAIDVATEPLLVALIAGGRTVRLKAKGRGDLDRLCAENDWQEVVAAPLIEGDQIIGFLSVYDPSGVEGDTRDELAILDTLAREAAATIQKGRAVQSTLQERALLASLVANASDGILTVGTDGAVRSWNPGLSRITGWDEQDMVGIPALSRLRPTTADGRPVELDRWATTDDWPTELQIVDRDGQSHALECSYGLIPAREAGDDTLVIVARDITGAHEVMRLQQEVGRLEALERTQRHFVNQLQDAVRPERPLVEGVDMAVEYLPSDPSAPSGGDLYDWQVLPDGDLHLAVVDVLGHGVSATKDAVTVTHLLRILSLTGCPLADLMKRAEAVLNAQQSGLVATALVARYRPETGHLQIAGAGHPPALVVRDGGAVEQVSARGIPLGWPGAGSEAVVELVLEPHDMLVLYTDGLIEATRDIIKGLNALEAAAAEMRSLPVSELVAQLVERSLAGSVRRDDSLALVVRRHGDHPFRHELPADPSAVRFLRRALAAWLQKAGRPPEDIDVLVLVASELATNALRSGATCTVVRAWVEDGHEVLEVEDDGPGFVVLDAPEMPLDEYAERGRGLFISRRLVDSLDVARRESGTVVTARRRADRSAPISREDAP